MFCKNLKAHEARLKAIGQEVARSGFNVGAVNAAEQRANDAARRARHEAHRKARRPYHGMTRKLPE